MLGIAFTWFAASVSAADNRVLLCDLCLIVLPVSASCNDPEALLVKHVEPMQGS